MESQYIYKLCNSGFGYRGDCFDWVAIQPPGMNPCVMIPSFSKCPDNPKKDEVYQDPVFGNYGCTNYFGANGTSPTAGDGILLHGDSRSAISLGKITDGPSRTIIMGERGISDLLYGWPYCGSGDSLNTGDGDNLMSTQLGLSPGAANGNDNYHFWSYHPHVAQFLFADGSGRPLTYDIDFSLFQALSTRAGGEPVQVP